MQDKNIQNDSDEEGFVLFLSFTILKKLYTQKLNLLK